MPRTPVALVAAAQFVAAAAFAATPEFTPLAFGNLGASVTPGGVTCEGNTTLLVRSGTQCTDAGGATCAKRGRGTNCTGDMNIRFCGRVKKLWFHTAGYQAGDVATIRICRGGEMVGSTGVALNGRIGLGTYRKITRIRIEYEGVEARRPPRVWQMFTHVPAAAGLPLLFWAPGLLGVLRLRAKMRSAAADGHKNRRRGMGPHGRQSLRGVTPP
jgi:hypothetical protein